MKKIIPRVERELLEKELLDCKFVKNTNLGENEIYVFTYKDSPMLMRELGRLRELTFREAGGGTGKEIDIDKFDISEKPFKQLIVWDPKAKEIVGGYRYILGSDLPKDENGNIFTPTSKLFKFSDKFINDYLPYSIELGRSFVQPLYQPLNDLRKGVYSLDNIWNGLGSIIVDNPEAKYFFGKITMYTHSNINVRNLILFFLKKYFPDNESLIRPFEPLKFQIPIDELDNIFTAGNYKEDYKILNKKVRSFNENIPPLVNAYMNLSLTMRTFGTAVNHSFGEVEETGILITIDDIFEGKKQRHVFINNSIKK